MSTPEPTDTSSGNPHPLDDPLNIRVGYKEGVTLPSHGELVAVMTLPLPGIKIFVHGVNSDGEWYEAAEKGLCDGLNRRLARRDENLALHGPEAGQLSPCRYMSELTPDGFINPDMDSSTFVQADDAFSPVIRFRWGYKASGDELQQFGKGLYLNEQDYWGGGPFANGCSSLPDLWGQGIEDELFLFLHVQHLNSTNDRKVYSAPPRPYYVLAAHRLAKLVEAIRRKQADVPITIICHSQGNMVGICAAFLGDAMPEATDAAGRQGRCVADTYVLCNPPYSLLDKNGPENWAERHMQDKDGNRGRQTVDARLQTLANFFKIVQKQAACEQDAARIDKRMANPKHGFNAHDDKFAHGYGLKPSTHGRVTLYCNPHDQVISATTIQGIGWRGVSDAEISAMGGATNFTQRVFAQGFTVGDDVKREYHYWDDHWDKATIAQKGEDFFWYPPSLNVEYSIRKGWDADRPDNPANAPRRFLSWGQVFTAGLGVLFIVGLKIARMKINGMPEKNWKLSLKAPALPNPFTPVAVRMGHQSDHFDQGVDSPADYRDRNLTRGADDPMASGKGMPQGDEKSEAALQYETHAAVRLQAKRVGLYASDAKVVDEDKPETALKDYKNWRAEQVKTMLAENIDTHATDHSTIMTNPMHAEKALAYDVAIGVCDICAEDLKELRRMADWRFLYDLSRDNSHQKFSEYFRNGKLRGVSCYQWAHTSKEGSMPKSIVDRRDGSTLLSVGKFL